MGLRRSVLSVCAHWKDHFWGSTFWTEDSYRYAVYRCGEWL